MRSIVFDAGPIISLTMNNLLHLLPELKSRFKGDFFITREVYRELVEQPLGTKKYKFEAMQILPYVADGTLKIVEHEALRSTADRLLMQANRAFGAEHNRIQIVHPADMEVVAAAVHLSSEAVVFDERTTRMLIESPLGLRDHLARKLHTEIHVDHEDLKRISQEIGHLKVIRSFELVELGFEMGLLDRFIAKGEESYVKGLRSKLIEGALWSIKLSGCSVSQEEIEEALALLRD
jgi:hypothetical protein